jgi:hypothetical protein
MWQECPRCGSECEGQEETDGFWFECDTCGKTWMDDGMAEA